MQHLVEYLLPLPKVSFYEPFHAIHQQGHCKGHRYMLHLNNNNKLTPSVILPYDLSVIWNLLK